MHERRVDEENPKIDEKVRRAFLRYVSRRVTKMLGARPRNYKDGIDFSHDKFNYAVSMRGNVISVDMKSSDESVPESDLARFVELEVQSNNLFRDGEPFSMYSQTLEEFGTSCKRVYDGKPSIKCEVMRMPSRRGTLFDRVYDCVIRPALFVSRYRMRYR